MWQNNEEEDYYVLDEGFLDKGTFSLIKKWKTSNEKNRIKKFKSTTVSPQDAAELKDEISTMRTEDISYDEYKKAFHKFCTYIHTIDKGVILRTIKLTKNKDDDNFTLYVEYADNTKKIKLPEDCKLYHLTKVSGIKKLIPFFKGKSERGYLYDKPRIYFTIRKKMPKFLADYKVTDKMYTYECEKDIKDVYIDPLVPSFIQGAVYIETQDPVPVEQVGIKAGTNKEDEVEAKNEAYIEEKAERESLKALEETGFDFDEFFDMLIESGLEDLEPVIEAEDEEEKEEPKKEEDKSSETKEETKEEVKENESKEEETEDSSEPKVIKNDEDESPKEDEDETTEDNEVAKAEEDTTDSNTEGISDEDEDKEDKPAEEKEDEEEKHTPESDEEDEKPEDETDKAEEDSEAEDIDDELSNDVEEIEDDDDEGLDLDDEDQEVDDDSDEEIDVDDNEEPTDDEVYDDEEDEDELDDDEDFDDGDFEEDDDDDSEDVEDIDTAEGISTDAEVVQEYKKVGGYGGLTKVEKKYNIPKRFHITSDDKKLALTMGSDTVVYKAKNAAKYIKDPADLNRYFNPLLKSMFYVFKIYKKSWYKKFPVLRNLVDEYNKAYKGDDPIDIDAVVHSVYLKALAYVGGNAAALAGLGAAEKVSAAKMYKASLNGSYNASYVDDGLTDKEYISEYCRCMEDYIDEINESSEVLSESEINLIEEEMKDLTNRVSSIFGDDKDMNERLNRIEQKMYE